MYSILSFIYFASLLSSDTVNAQSCRRRTSARLAVTSAVLASSTPAATTLISVTRSSGTNAIVSPVVVASSELVAAPVAAVPAAASGAAAAASDSLDAKFKAKRKQYFGIAADRGTLNVAQNAEIANRVFGQVTPENSMKWDSTEPSQGQFNFDRSDYLVNFAQNNSKLVRGHALLWHSQLAPWVSTLSTAEDLKTALENHVTTVVSRYAGKVYAWDVVNEILAEDGSFRSSVWNQPSKGIDVNEMVKIAFTAAKAADPAAKLYINDYNLDSATYPKTTGMAAKVKQWISEGVPIDGIGSQSHLKAGQAGGVKAALQTLCAAAPECAITELDIEGANAQEYVTAVTACVEIDNCVGVTVWGISDKDSWRADKTPLLFDASFQPKPAFDAVLGAIS